MAMIVRSIATLALYCLRCGQLHMHDISRFVLKDMRRLSLACNCGNHQATLIYGGRKQIFLDIPCGVCQTNHSICIPNKNFWHTKVEKLYCLPDNLELGFIGQRSYIEQMLADRRHEFECQYDEIDDYDVLDPAVMVGVLNKIHDIAETGNIHCSCGRMAITAELAATSIVLVCKNCGARCIIPAGTSADLTQLATVNSIELSAQQPVCRNPIAMRRRD